MNQKTVTHYFIGEGGEEGCVIGDHTNPNFVSKIGLNYFIIKEYRNIKCLPLDGPWVRPNEVELLKIDPKDVNDVVSLCPKLKKFIDDVRNKPKRYSDPSQYPELSSKKTNEVFVIDDNIYEIRMPFVKGISYGKYLNILLDNSKIVIEKYRGSNHGDQSRVLTFSIPDEIIFKLLKILSNLYYELEKLYNQYYIDYGNDLHDLNIIYNEETNIITLIDWSNLEIGDMNKPFIMCSSALYISTMFGEILLSGVFSDITLQWLINNKIIRDISYNEINFMDNIMLINQKDLIPVVSGYL